MRVQWIEAARTLAMALVVAVHANILSQPSVDAWWPGGYESFLLYALAVPTFFLLSGYVLALAHPPGAPLRRGHFARRKVVTLLLPWAAWNVVMLAVHTAVGDPPDAERVLTTLALGEWQLYFIVALSQLFVLFAALHPLFDRHAGKVAAAALLLSAAFYGLADVLLWTDVSTDDLFEGWLNRLFAPWAGFFFLGFWLGRDTSRVARLARFWWLFAAAALGSFVPYAWETRWIDATFWGLYRRQLIAAGFPYQVLGPLALVGLLAWLEQRAPRAVALLARGGRDTFGIYLSHTAILLLLAYAWEKLEWPDERVPFIPAMAAATWLCAFALVRLCRWRPLRPGARILFGARG